VRALPARSRVTVRRAGANLLRSAQFADALRESREAMLNIEGQLDALLAALRDPTAAPDAGAPERLRGATCHADSALAALGALARRR
jgi:hypothetical protein